MVDVTDATFETLVVQRSMQVPVVIDLWAEWCGPCRTLGPILERVVAEADGHVDLAKVDVDANPVVAQAFRVQGIPAVFAMREQRVVDQFVGAQGEPFVREFVARLLPTVEETELERLVRSGDEASLRAALDIEADHPPAVTALAELLVGRGEPAEALALLARIAETPDVRRIQALARTAGAGGAPTDPAAELESLLDRVKGDDDARQRYVDLLEVMGPDDPRTAEYRRRLTSRLF
ncbi:MAG: tetratricopeptide repeat protein [Microthrixaceae bacterium]